MEPYKRDFFIARIRAGFVPVRIGELRFTVHQPDAETSLYAHEKYIEAYEEAEDEGLLTDDDILENMINQGIWSAQTEEEYTRIVPGHIEYWKIELYQSSLKSNTRQTVRKYLQTAKAEYARLHELRNFYNYTTVDGYANLVRTMYTIKGSTKLDGKQVDWEEHNILQVMRRYHDTILTAEELRILARTAPWSNMWSVLKTQGKIFNNDELTVEQQSLISWSIMYDKIYESPDCPADEVIEDDDMLDGWLLVQKRKRDAERKRQEIEGHVNPKMKNADEIYMIAETAEDAQKIDMMNPEHVKRIKQSRLKQIDEKGFVKQQEFKDVQQKRSMQMQQAYVQNVKGR